MPVATLSRNPSTVPFVLSTILGYEVTVAEDGIPTIRPGKYPGLDKAPHAFPYQGSKRTLAHAILRFMPVDTARLVEPFAGSAAVAIAARYTKKAPASVISDVNGPLMDLWRAILTDPHNLANQYANLWNESGDDPEGWKPFFLAKRDEFNRSHDPVLLLYLLNRIVKGAVRYSRDGAFNQSADNRRRGAKPDTVRDRLVDASKTLAGTTVLNDPYETVLLAADPADVVYMDPPYQGVTDVPDHRYMAGLRRVDYETVLAQAVEKGLSFIVSYDAVTPDNRYGEPLTDTLGLTHLHIAAGQSAQATLSGRKEETLESLYLSPALMARLAVPQDTLL